LIAFDQVASKIQGVPPGEADERTDEQTVQKHNDRIMTQTFSVEYLFIQLKKITAKSYSSQESSLS
jgi:hypothetical protein